jgi:predicted nucleic acid-binding protein
LTRWVLDASVLIKWFKPEREADVDAALTLARAYGAGTLMVAAPRLLLLEVLNPAARRWHWSVGQMSALASDLGSLRFQFLEPALPLVGHWVNRGLTAYDACYVALAEELDTFVVTADEQILQVAPAYARAISHAVGELGG